MKLNVASKANQAITFPAVLVAHYIQELDPHVSLKTNFEEVDALKFGDAASIELMLGDGTSITGTDRVLQKFVQSYNFLQLKQQKLVS